MLWRAAPTFGCDPPGVLFDGRQGWHAAAAQFDGGGASQQLTQGDADREKARDEVPMDLENVAHRAVVEREVAGRCDVSFFFPRGEFVLGGKSGVQKDPFGTRP